jgi:hypothetical protein
MKKFAVIALPDGGERIVAQNAFLRNLPDSLAKRLIGMMTPRIIGVVKDAEEDYELGYIIDVPCFFMGLDKLSPHKKQKQLDILHRRLLEKEIQILAFPHWKQFFNYDEIRILQDNGIAVLDGYLLRMATLLDSIEHMFKILKNSLHRMEIGIWRADTEIGSVWAQFAAPYINNMVIGGERREDLERLSENILKSTGLSCQVVTDIGSCTRGKDILVITEEDQLDGIGKSKIIIYCNHLTDSYVQTGLKNKSQLFIDAGMLSFPEDVAVDVGLKPWEKIGVIDGLLYSISEYYRTINSSERICLEHVIGLRQLLKQYPLYIEGFTTITNSISYDKFRMEYLRFVP